MDKLEIYLDEIIQKNLPQDMDEVGNIFIEMAEYIQDCDEKKYHNICTKLYELARGKTISKEVAEEWVNEMEPDARWTIEETTQAMKNLGYNFNPLDFYVVANMMYSDNYNLVKDNEVLALKMACNWLSDKDVGKDKLYNYFKYVVKEV